MKEAVRFLQFLGHSDICLRCDQEPAILTVQNLLQCTWQRMGHRAVIENSKLLDHASNSWVEKAVGNVRNMSSALLHELSKRLKHEIPVGHPLFSWAFIHACWIRNRFGVGAGVTSYELSRGHVYRGRLCQFAEPVMCFVGDTIQHKGYMAQERFDIQYATKTLASSLKDPTWKAWLNLGRLIGYLRCSETFALKVNKCEKGRVSWKQCLECMVNAAETTCRSSQTVTGQVQAA